MKILYVEDNPANLFLIRRVAKMGNHEIVNYIDGEEVLRKIDITKPDLILMDIQLAGDLSGLDVVRQLRKDGYTMPIIAVTAYAMVGDRERCLEAGCDDYIAKPLPINRIVELFDKYQKEVHEAEKRQTAAHEAAGAAAPSDDMTDDVTPVVNGSEQSKPPLKTDMYPGQEAVVSEKQPIVNGSEDKPHEEKKRAAGETMPVMVEPAANNND